MNNAEKVSVTMTRDMMRIIRESVDAGEFSSTSEAMRDAVRVWQRQRLEDAERLTTIRARVQRSLADLRPNISEGEADAHFQALLKAADKDAGSAPA